MKDFDMYVLVTGLILLSGIVSSTGLNLVTNFSMQAEYTGYVVLACGVTLGVIVLKYNQRKSSNN